MYYKRLTNVTTFNPHHYFTNKWYYSGGSESNQAEVDFTLHQTVEDAISGDNPYQYYSQGQYSYYGPFANSGPTGSSGTNYARIAYSGIPNYQYHALSTDTSCVITKFDLEPVSPIDVSKITFNDTSGVMTLNGDFETVASINLTIGGVKIGSNQFAFKSVDCNKEVSFSSLTTNYSNAIGQSFPNIDAGASSNDTTNCDISSHTYSLSSTVTGITINAATGAISVDTTNLISSTSFTVIATSAVAHNFSSNPFTIEVFDPCHTATFDSSAISTPSQYHQTKFETSKFTTSPSGCAISYQISSTLNAISAPADLELDTSGSNIVVRSSVSGVPAQQHTFYLKATITDSNASPVWTSQLTWYQGCSASWITLSGGNLVSSMNINENEASQFIFRRSNGLTVTQSTSGCTIVDRHLSSSSSQQVGFGTGTTVVPFFTTCVSNCESWNITASTSFEFYVGYSIQPSSDSSQSPVEVYYQTAIPVTVISRCSSANFVSPQIGYPLYYSTTYWFNTLYTTNPSNCAITYEISTQSGTVVAPPNLNSTVYVGSSYINVYILDTSQVTMTEFYLKATITDSSQVNWSEKVSLYQGCSSQWTEISTHSSNYVSTFSVAAGQTGTYTLTSDTVEGLYVSKPTSGCGPVEFAVSGSSSSITPVVGGTVTKQAGCSDPCKLWDVTPASSNQSSSFVFYFVVTIPNNIVLQNEDALVTVTVASGCTVGSFDTTAISNETQYSLASFSSPLFTTIPSGCPITYQISTESGSVISPQKLNSAVNISDGTNFVISANGIDVSEFYLKASIDTSSNSAFWSNKLTLYHTCRSDYSILSDDGSFQKTLSGFAGKDIPYTIKGLSLTNPTGCQITDYKISNSSTSQEDFDFQQSGVRVQSNDSSKLTWNFYAEEKKAISFYVHAIFMSNQQEQHLFSQKVDLNITNCKSEEGVKLRQGFNTSQLCIVNQNCTVGDFVSVNLTDSLQVTDKCLSDLSLGKQFTIRAINYTKGMNHSFTFANNSVQVATPRSNQSEHLQIEIIAISDSGQNISSGKFLQFDFLLGVNDAPYFKNMQVAQIVKDVAQYTKLVDNTTDAITADISIKQSEQTTDLAWYTFFTAKVDDDEQDKFLLEYSEKLNYEKLIQVVYNDSDVDFQINLNQINDLTSKNMSLTLILRDIHSTLTNTYKINLGIFYTQDMNEEPAFIPTFDVEEEVVEEESTEVEESNDEEEVQEIEEESIKEEKDDVDVETDSEENTDSDDEAQEILDSMDSEELEELQKFLEEKAAEDPEPVGAAWDEEEEEEESDIVEKVEEVVPSKPPGFKEIDPILLFNLEKDMEKERLKKQQALKEKQKKEFEETGVEPEPPKPVKMKIGGISKDGNMGLGFNQPLDRPSFTDKEGRRILANADQIDMSKVIGIKMEPQSDVQANKLKYYIEVVEWTEDKLDVKVKFKDSDQLSQGETNDQMIIEVKDPGYFASKDSGVVPDPKDQNPDDTQNSVPEQLPDGMSEEQIAKSAAQGKNTGLTVVILQIVAQIFLKKGMDKMWALFFTLQLVQSITIYSQSIPPVSQVWVEQIRSLVDFEMLKPDPLMQLYDRDLSVKHIMNVIKNQTMEDKEVMTKNFDSSGIQSSDFVVNMSTIILIVVAAIILLFILIILAVILPSQKLRDKIRGKLVTAKEGFFWNGFIRSQSISYLTMCLSISALYKDMTNKQEQDSSQVGNFIAIMTFLVLYPLVIIFYLRGKDQEELADEKKQAKIGNLIKGIKLSRNKWAKYYYPIFMVRRLIFVMIVMFIPFDSCIQMQSLIFSSSLYIIWYVGVWPHLEKKEIYLEIINEVLMQLIFYHLMVFSEFYVGEGRRSLKLYASYSFVVVLGLIILINLIYVLTQMFWQIKKYLRQRKLKNDALKQNEINQGMILKKEAKSKELDKIFQVINPNARNQENEQERRRQKQLEDEEFEKNLSAQIDQYEQKNGKLKREAESDSESQESIQSRKERKKLKKKLNYKVQKAKSKMRAKASGKNRNNGGINMETIQENSFDSDIEDSGSNSSKSVSQNTEQVIGSEVASNAGFQETKEVYQLPKDDVEDPQPKILPQPSRKTVDHQRLLREQKEKRLQDDIQKETNVHLAHHNSMVPMREIQATPNLQNDLQIKTKENQKVEEQKKAEKVDPVVQNALNDLDEIERILNGTS